MAFELAALTTSDWLGLAGLVLAVGGLGFAIHQVRLARQEIRKSVTAAEAARDAITATERQTGLIELLRVIPRLQRLERDINLAVHDSNRTALANHLQDWRVLAAETRGILGEQGYGSEGLASWLRESSSASAQAIEALERDPIGPTTKRVLTVIAGACEEAGVLMGQLKSHPGKGAP